MRNRVAGAITFAFGLLAALTPRYIMPVCEFAGKKKMYCGYMGRAEVFLGVIVVAVAIGAFASKGQEALRWLMFVAFVSGASIIMLPEVLGYCPSTQMPCNYGTVPLLRLLGVLIIITSAVGFMLSMKRARE